MKKKTLFVTRLLMGISFGALLASPGFAMEERDKRPAPAVLAKLNTEQDAFMRKVHDLVISNIRRPLLELASPLECLEREEASFKEFFEMCYGLLIKEESSKIKKAFDFDFDEIGAYYRRNREKIAISINVEAYLASLKEEFQPIRVFLGNVDAFLGNPSKAEAGKLAQKAKTFIDPFDEKMGKFHISEHTKTLNAFFYKPKEISAEELAAQRLKALRLEEEQREAARLQALERAIAPYKVALGPLTARIETLIAPVAGGRDRDGYSLANEGIMRLGNNAEGGGLPLLEDLRSLLRPLVGLKEIAYLEPKEGAALGFSKEDAIAFYQTLVSANHLDASGMIVESFVEMMTSPAYNQDVLLRFCKEKSQDTFQGIYTRYDGSKTRQNKHALAEAILKLGVVDGHSTRLLHPLALAKSFWDEKPELRSALLEILPQYFIIMADQVGKCAAGATGRAILMTRLLAEVLTKSPLK